MATKLEVVQSALRSNPNVVIVDTLIQKYPQLEYGWNQTYNIKVAPKTPIYRSRQLQEFMLGLVPIKPDSIDDFSETPYTMSFGKLYFDDIEIAKGLKRRTWVSVYPDTRIAQDPEFNHFIDAKPFKQITGKVFFAKHMCNMDFAIGDTRIRNLNISHLDFDVKKNGVPSSYLNVVFAVAGDHVPPGYVQDSDEGVSKIGKLLVGGQLEDLIHASGISHFNKDRENREEVYFYKKGEGYNHGSIKDVAEAPDIGFEWMIATMGGESPTKAED